MAARQLWMLVLGLAVLSAPTNLTAWEVGDWVAVRRTAKLIASGEEVDQLIPGQVVRVLAVGKGQVWVSHGRPGWLATSNIVAIDQAESLISQSFANGASPGDYLARGRIRLAVGKVDLGIADLKRAAELASQRGEFLEPLGFAYLAANDPASAIRSFSSALQKQPQSVDAVMGRGLAYFQAGQNENAQADFTQAIKLDPEHAFPRKHLGVLLHELGQLDAAEQSLRKAIELDTHDSFSRKALGRLLFDRGQLKAARDAFSIAIKLDPKDAEALTGRGVVRHAIGDLKGAEADDAAAVAAAKPSSDDAYLWSNLGQVQMELGKYREALVNLDKAIELNPEFNEARSHRAFLLLTQPASLSSRTIAMNRAAADMRLVFKSAEPKTFWDYRSLAVVNAQRGELKRAADYQGQAVEQLRESGPERFLEPAIEALKRYQTE